MLFALCRPIISDAFNQVGTHAVTQGNKSAETKSVFLSVNNVPILRRNLQHFNYSQCVAGFIYSMQ